MIRKEFILDLQKEIDAAPYGSKRKIIEEWASNLNVSHNTLYRELQKYFGKKRHRKSETKIPEQLIIKIEDLKKKWVKEGKNKKEISTKKCIQKLIDDSVPGANELKVSSVNRRLKSKGFSIKAPNKGSYTKEEIRLVRFFRNLTPKQKRTIFDTISIFLDKK